MLLKTIILIFSLIASEKILETPEIKQNYLKLTIIIALK